MTATLLASTPAAHQPGPAGRFAPGKDDQEFSLSPADFERVRELIYKRAGISLNDGKQAMVYSRLSRRVRETTFKSFGQYLDWLQQSSGPQAEEEWQ